MIVSILILIAVIIPIVIVMQHVLAIDCVQDSIAYGAVYGFAALCVLSLLKEVLL